MNPDQEPWRDLKITEATTLKSKLRLKSDSTGCGRTGGSDATRAHISTPLAPPTTPPGTYHRAYLDRIANKVTPADHLT